MYFSGCALPSGSVSANTAPCPCDCPPAKPAVPAVKVVASTVKDAPSVVRVAEKYVGIRETGGRNRGPEIDRWNRAAGAPLGSSYCASSVGGWLSEADVARPRLKTAWARNYEQPYSIKPDRVARGVARVPVGSVVVWKRPGGGHVGIVTRWRGSTGDTIEANTSSGLKGSQHDGDGIFRRKRTINALSAFRITAFTPVTEKK